MKSGNINRRPVGKCSCCGGVVSVPTVYMSVCRPPVSCESCGAVADPARNLPVIKTRRVDRDATNDCNLIQNANRKDGWKNQLKPPDMTMVQRSPTKSRSGVNVVE